MPIPPRGMQKKGKKSCRKKVGAFIGLAAWDFGKSEIDGLADVPEAKNFG
jgi:hypothetical protein